MAADEVEPYFPPLPEGPLLVVLAEVVALPGPACPTTAVAANKHNREHKRESPNRECALQCTVHRP